MEVWPTEERPMVWTKLMDELEQMSHDNCVYEG